MKSFRALIMKRYIALSLSPEMTLEDRKAVFARYTNLMQHASKK